MEEAIFAGGCFWGVEHLLKELDGVESTECGYTGGQVKNPTYQQVCTGKTGHAEAVKVIFNSSLISFEDLAKFFFEIHDPTQWNGQGPDLGPQYRSAIFYTNDEQKQIAKRLTEQLRRMGLDVKTELQPASTFYPAEKYHQKYYDKTGKLPYCHRHVKLF